MIVPFELFKAPVKEQILVEGKNTIITRYEKVRIEPTIFH